jgi:hypothetical protein
MNTSATTAIVSDVAALANPVALVDAATDPIRSATYRYYTLPRSVLFSGATLMPDDDAEVVAQRLAEAYDWDDVTQREAELRIADLRYFLASQTVNLRAQIPLGRNEADLCTYFQLLDLQYQRAQDYLYQHMF